MKKRCLDTAAITSVFISEKQKERKAVIQQVRNRQAHLYGTVMDIGIRAGDPCKHVLENIKRIRQCGGPEENPGEADQQEGDGYRYNA